MVVHAIGSGIFRWKGKLAVLAGNEKNLGKASYQAGVWFVLDITWGNEEEGESGEEHKCCWDPKTQFPAKMVLDVNYSCQGKNDSNGLRSYVPTYEAL